MSLPTAFENGLRAAINKRERLGYSFSLPPPVDRSKIIDFGTNDTLSLNSSGVLRQEVLREIARNPDFQVGYSGSRVNQGAPYIDEVEKHLARFHGAPDGLFFNSGYEGNTAIFSTLPKDGDAIVYDSLVHASIHDGMKATRASIVRPFEHNDVASLLRVINHLKEESSPIREGHSTVFIAFETVYSMDGDLAPAKEIVDLAKEILPLGNFILIADEAHSNGLLGPHGAGYISALGLEKDVAVRLHTCAKGLGSAGAIVLCDPLVKSMFVNFARMFIFTAAPTFLTGATVKAAYNILESEDGAMRRRRLQENLRYFYGLLDQQPRWHVIKEQGIIRIPCGEGWKAAPFLAPIIPLITKPGKSGDLKEKLGRNGLWANAVSFPAVEKDAERIRGVMHADNTEEQIKALVRTIIEWGSTQMATPKLASGTLHSRL